MLISKVAEIQKLLTFVVMIGIFPILVINKKVLVPFINLKDLIALAQQII